MKLTIEIDLSSSSLTTYADALEAIRKSFDSVIPEQNAPNDTTIEADETGLVRDANYRDVGKWEVIA